MKEVEIEFEEKEQEFKVYPEGGECLCPGGGGNINLGERFNLFEEFFFCFLNSFFKQK